MSQVSYGTITITDIPSSSSTNQHFWFNPTQQGTLLAGAYITEIDIDTFKSNKAGGYILARSNGIEFGRGTYKSVELIAGTQNDALNFYEPNSNIIDASLTTKGLILSKGGIEAGTKNSSDYIYVTSSDDATDHTLAINNSGDKSDWRIVAGNKFGVDKAGNLYASSANISGVLTVQSGSNVYTKTESDNKYEAEGEVAKYITYISAEDGIKVHNTNDSSNYLQLNSTAVSIFKSGTEKIRLEVSNLKLGDSSDYININSNGLKIYKNGYLKGDFGSVINLYGGDDTEGTYPKTTINSDGIIIAYNNLYNTNINSTGMQVYAGDSTKSIANFGQTTIFGNNDSGNYDSYVQIDKKSFKMFRSKMVNNKIFLNFSDLRDEDGYLYVEESFNWGDGTVGSYASNAKRLNYTATTDKPAIVYIDNSAVSDSVARISGGAVYFWDYENIPDDTPIKLTYYTTSSDAQCFTFGSRAYNDSGLDAAPGALSMSVGTSNSVGGHSSVAFGYNNNVKGNYSLAIGSYNVINNQNCLCAGNSNKANGYYSHCIGYGLTAGGSYQVVVGSYNNKNSTGRFIVGTGDYSNPRSGLIVNSLGAYIDGSIAATGIEYTSGSYITCTTLISDGLTYYKLGQTGSTKRIKEEIDIIKDSTLEPDKLYNLPVRQFKYKEGVLMKEDPYNLSRPIIPGFIAEEIEEFYPAACIKQNGDPSDWDVRRIVPSMLALIQKQHKQIEELNKRLEKIENN